nr:DUF938 domain-containing protein [Sphingomonas arenae]
MASPSVARNTTPILEVLADWLPASGRMLEVASGSGEHAVAFARAFPQLEWQPSDPDGMAVESISAWCEEAGCTNLLPPLRLDVRAEDWGVNAADALLAINMVHISPWEASIGLLDGAARLLPSGGPLILYGPWLVKGEPTAPSNLAFDADLRSRNPEWGLRKVEDFRAEGAERGLSLVDQRAMPANNRMLLFRRS